MSCSNQPMLDAPNFIFLGKLGSYLSDFGLVFSYIVERERPRREISSFIRITLDSGANGDSGCCTSVLYACLIIFVFPRVIQCIQSYIGFVSNASENLQSQGS